MNPSWKTTIALAVTAALVIILLFAIFTAALGV